MQNEFYQFSGNVRVDKNIACLSSLMTSRRPWRNKIESGQFSFYLLYSYVRYVVMKKLSWGKVGESIIKLSIDKINDCHNENCF